MKNWGVTIAAITGIGSPDVLNWVGLIESLNPLLDALVRAGQIGVAVVTILYIYRKSKRIPTRRRKK